MSSLVRAATARAAMVATDAGKVAAATARAVTAAAVHAATTTGRKVRVIRPLLVMSLLSLIGCGAQSPAPRLVPEGPAHLTSFYYTATHGYRGFTNRGYRAERQQDGRVCLTLELRDDRDRVFLAEASVMDSLEAIIKEYRMERYKERYKPMFDVKDGDSWRVTFGYSDGKRISSDGYFVMPDRAGEAFTQVEALFAPWREMEPAGAALKAFRFELHTDEGSEVFSFKKEDTRNSVYFRRLGSSEGWNYYCGDPQLPERLDKELRQMNACSYCGEKLSEEDKSRPRWIAIIEYEDGHLFELMDYLDRDGGYHHRPPTHTERVLRSAAERCFSAEIERIGTLPPEQIGEHSCTSYNAKGEPQRTINYAGDGTVLSGRDYNNPNLDF